MTAPETTGATLHELLLRLSGQVPGDVIAGVRDWLAEGRFTEVAGVIAAAVETGQLAPSRAELAALVRIRPDLDADALAGAADRAPATAGRSWEFAPLLPQAAMTIPVVLDLTTGPDAPDPIDTAAVDAAELAYGSVALWRAWRAPDSASPAVSRAYLLLTEADPAELPALTARLQSALRAVGVEEPQVEVFRADTDLPHFQRSARGRSALLWATTPAVPVTIARDFDGVDQVGGPAFAPEHPLLAGDEPGAVLEYLAGGEVLLATTARELDIFDGARGEVVPQSFRTDGTWIWTDTVAYYLENYGLAPEQDFLDHIRVRGYTRPELDDVARHRAMVELFRPIEDGVPA